MIEDNIILYLYENSKGVIKLSPGHARHIVNMVIGSKKQSGAAVQLFRYGQENVPVLLRTVPTTNEAINEAIITALKEPPTMGFYLYKLYNDLKQFEGHIYSANPNLF